MMAAAGLPWPPLLVGLPLLAGAAAFVCRPLARALALLGALGQTIALAGLTRTVLAHGPVHDPLGGWPAPPGIGLHADGLTLLLLWTTTTVGTLVTIYSCSYFPRKDPARGSPDHAFLFWPLWLFLWAGLNGLYLSADLFNIYVCLELIGLAAVALAALAGRPAARRAAMRYLLINLLASLLYLLGVILLYRELGTLALAGLTRAAVARPAGQIALSFMVAALLIKAAVFPLHFWLPPAHANAPAPVSALLSALVVKASLYLLLRFWLQFSPLPHPALFQFLGLLGGAAILWGSLQALAAERLKTLIAYSTVAQLGYLFLLFPLQEAADRFTVWSGILFLVLSHALAKAALFLAAGIVHHQTGGDRLRALTGISQSLPLTSLSFSMAGISLMGLPPTAGFVAKWNLLQAAVASGRWWWAAVIVGGSLLTAAYLFRPIALTFRQAPTGRLRAPAVMEWPAFALAAAGVLLGLFPSRLLPLLAVGLPWLKGTG